VERFGVVVVGAGPAGSLAARAAAESGARTLLVDHRPELGHPVQCGEFVPDVGELADLFDCPELIGRAFDIPEATVLRRTGWMACVSPYGHRFRFPLRGATVSRRAFDKALAYRAEGAGAELRYPLGVTGLAPDGISTTTGETIAADVVVGADGPLSTVGRAAGLLPARTLYRMITATVDGDPGDEIRLHFGREAPGGYAWAFPRAHDVNVGLGVPTVGHGENLQGMLDRFVRHQGFGPTREPTRWWVPIGDPPTSLVRGRVALCGDAANLVMATNGGGIPTAMLSGWLAGQAAAATASRGTPLAAYDRAWRSAMAGPLARAARLWRWGDRVAAHDLLLAVGMRYIGTSGLDSMMRLRWPSRLGRGS
jgi:digeranylgeranylglycerophospholipid reductase